MELFELKNEFRQMSVSFNNGIKHRKKSDLKCEKEGGTIINITEQANVAERMFSS